jgi:GNAT superfamily N-acetyltransferase
MAIRPDPARPGWQRLVEPGGTPVARYLGSGRRADLLELCEGVGVERALPTILADLQGFRVSGSEGLGRALVAAGACPSRHAHVLSRDLRADPAWQARPAPDGLSLAPADRPAAELVAACVAAYPPGHPDGGRVDVVTELGRILAGEQLGPLLDCSGVAVDRDGVVRAAVLVTGSPGEPPFGGPWVCDCFREPGFAGAGRALMERALLVATRAGLGAVGLAVTEGNSAASLYAALGFRRVLTSFAVEL